MNISIGLLMLTLVLAGACGACGGKPAAVKAEKDDVPGDYNVHRYYDRIEIETDTAGASVTLNFTGRMAKRVETDNDLGVYDNCNGSIYNITLLPYSTCTFWMICDNRSCGETPRIPGLFNISEVSDPDRGVLRYRNYFGEDAVTITVVMNDLRIDPTLERE